jgi:hypothetical protein
MFVLGVEFLCPPKFGVECQRWVRLEWALPRSVDFDLPSAVAETFQYPGTEGL